MGQLTVGIPTSNGLKVAKELHMSQVGQVIATKHAIVTKPSVAMVPSVSEHVTRICAPIWSVLTEPDIDGLVTRRLFF
jgi:hypothetical protein